MSAYVLLWDDGMDAVRWSSSVSPVMGINKFNMGSRSIHAILPFLSEYSCVVVLGWYASFVAEDSGSPAWQSGVEGGPLPREEDAWPVFFFELTREAGQILAPRKYDKEVGANPAAQPGGTRLSHFLYKKPMVEEDCRANVCRARGVRLPLFSPAGRGLASGF